jgi:disulfide bond formation protein DsbB
MRASSRFSPDRRPSVTGPRHPLSNPIALADGALLILLAALLLHALWPFFGTFIAGAVAAGLILSVYMRRWHDRHPATHPRPITDSRRPEINFSALPIGGDPAGLLVTGGCVALVLVGLPPLRWYFAASMVCAVAAAAALIAWRRRQPAAATIHVT